MPRYYLRAMWEGFSIEQRDPQMSERMRGYFRKAARGIFVAAIVVTAAAALIAWKIPYSSDLYNLLYANSRPSKGEDTYTFLFTFPFFVWGIAMLLWFDPGSLLQNRCRGIGDAVGVCVGNAAAASMFAILAILRDADVWHHYF
jgi:hypothetical protein